MMMHESRDELVDILDKLLELYVLQAEATVGDDPSKAGEIKDDIAKLEKRKAAFTEWHGEQGDSGHNPAFAHSRSLGGSVRIH